MWNLFKLFYKLQYSRSRDRINEVGPGTEFKESELRRWTTCRLIFLIAGSKVKSQEEFEWMIQIWTDGTQFSDPSKSCNWIPGLKLIFIVNLKLRALNLKVLQGCIFSWKTISPRPCWILSNIHLLKWVAEEKSHHFWFNLITDLNIHWIITGFYRGLKQTYISCYLLNYKHLGLHKAAQNQEFRIWKEVTIINIQVHTFYLKIV